MIGVSKKLVRIEADLLRSGSHLFALRPGFAFLAISEKIKRCRTIRSIRKLDLRLTIVETNGNVI